MRRFYEQVIGLEVLRENQESSGKAIFYAVGAGDDNLALFEEKRGCLGIAVIDTQILGCERAYAFGRSHPKIWPPVTVKPGEPEKGLGLKVNVIVHVWLHARSMAPRLDQLLVMHSAWIYVLCLRHSVDR